MYNMACNGASETGSGTYLSVWLSGEGTSFFLASWYLKRCLVVFQTMHCDTGLTSRELGRAQVRSILAPAGEFHFWFIVVMSAFRRFLSNMFHPLRCSGSQVCRVYCFPTYLLRLVKKSAPQADCSATTANQYPGSESRDLTTPLTKLFVLTKDGCPSEIFKFSRMIRAIRPSSRGERGLRWM